MLNAHAGSQFLAYRHLKNTGAQFTDDASAHFAECNQNMDGFHTVKDWSNWYHQLDNWLNLSAVTTLSSNLETYVASVVGLALDSDPGVLLGMPKAVDGAHLRKYAVKRSPQADIQIESCTKGDWSSRLSSLDRIFGNLPSNIRQFHSGLEEIRGIRNRFGHAVGRDIDASRIHGNIEVAPMESVSRARVNRLGAATWGFARELDRHLLSRHIGDFEAVNYYAELFPSQLTHVPLGQRAVNLKKSIGKFGAGLRGKLYCNGLVTYWESL
jgi:hypothetical protein